LNPKGSGWRTDGEDNLSRAAFCRPCPKCECECMGISLPPALPPALTLTPSECSGGTPCRQPSPLPQAHGGILAADPCPMPSPQMRARGDLISSPRLRSWLRSQNSGETWPQNLGPNFVEIVPPSVKGPLFSAEHAKNTLSFCAYCMQHCIDCFPRTGRVQARRRGGLRGLRVSRIVRTSPKVFRQVQYKRFLNELFT
jgi:hypothetical protein